MTNEDIKRLTAEEIMARAIDLSRDNVRRGGYPFAAVVVRDGVIVGEGCNSTVALHDPTAHGEVMAIRDAGQRLGSEDLSNCEIYTSCEPCPLCTAAIWYARLSRVVYANALQDCPAIGFDDGSQLSQEIAESIDRRRAPAERMMAADAKLVFEEWADLTDHRQVGIPG